MNIHAIKRSMTPEEFASLGGMADRHQRELALAQLLDECNTTLKIVAAGIWRDNKKNAWVLQGSAEVVDAVEECLEKIEAYIQGNRGE